MFMYFFYRHDDGSLNGKQYVNNRFYRDSEYLWIGKYLKHQKKM